MSCLHVIGLSWQLLFCRDLLMENWFFLDAPRWTVDIEAVDGMEVRMSCVCNSRRRKFKSVTDPPLRSICEKNRGGRPRPGGPDGFQHGWFRCVRSDATFLHRPWWFPCVRCKEISFVIFTQIQCAAVLHFTIFSRSQCLDSRCDYLESGWLHCSQGQSILAIHTI